MGGRIDVRLWWLALIEEKELWEHRNITTFSVSARRALIRHIHIISQWPESSTSKALPHRNGMQMAGTRRKTSPADNWLFLPCFCARTAIFTLLSSARWLFYQTKRLAAVHTGKGLSHPCLLSLPPPTYLPSLPVHVSSWLNQIPLVRRAPFGMTPDKNSQANKTVVRYCSCS